jgi:hypothetical protein
MKSLLTLDFADVTYSLPLPLMWSIIEPELGLVCANLPILPPIWAPYVPPSPSLSSTCRRAKITALSTPNAANDHFERLQGTSQECSVITGERTSEEFEMPGSDERNGSETACESTQSETGGPRIKVKTEVRVEY